MTAVQPVLVELPELVASEAVRAGVAKRAVRRRAAGETVVFVLGLGGSLVSLLQGPTALEAFVRWLVSHVDARREHTVLRLARGSDGRTILEVAPDCDVDAVVALMRDELGRK